MFVFIDLNWIRHPFAVNSFKISTQDQIDTLRDLGVNRLRWSPERSDPPPGSESPGAAGNDSTSEATSQRQALLDAMAADAEQREQRRALLARQRERMEACERKYVSTMKSFRQVLDNVRSTPEQARCATRKIVDGMVGQLLEQEESAIRLLSENAGEKHTLHTLNVAVISLLLGRTLGLDVTALGHLGEGALLHDLGKIELPERLRWRDSHLSTAERKLYEEHVELGVRIGTSMHLAPEVLAIIAQHHELADGRGYPRRLPNESIAPLARIVCLVNHYDNLCNPGNPADAVTPHEALSLIYAQMKRQYDANVLSQFIRMMGIYPPGSVVELSDGRLGLVISVNSSRPLKPSVVIYEARIPREEALVEDLERLPELGIRRSLKPLQLPKAVFDYLSPRQRVCYYFERARRADEGDLPP